MFWQQSGGLRQIHAILRNLQSFLLLRRVLARMAAPLFAPGKTDIDGALQQILADAPLTMRRTVTTP
jgi:hypothetical protein